MSPLAEDLLCFGIAALPTAEQGDCGLDVMVYWDGRDRTPVQWTMMRLELAVAIDAMANDLQWHSVLEACAELPSPDRTSAAPLVRHTAVAEAPAALAAASATMATQPQD